MLFDNFGYDFQHRSGRQNAAVDFAHAQGLDVIVSPFRPDDVFGNQVDPVHNPSGVATRIAASDFYLYESHGVRLGEYEDGAAWLQRSDALEAYRQSLSFRVLSITTTATDGPGAYDESRFFYAWHAALLYGHAATGWGEFEFSASGASSSQAPYRARPTLDPGTSFTGPVFHTGTLHTRGTDEGRLWLDTADRTFGFFPGSTGVPAGRDAGGRSLTLAPNPVRAAARLAFTLERPAMVRLDLYDVGGRRVAMLVAGDLAAGRHERQWSGVDDAGQRVATGIYFLVLEVDGERSVARVVLPEPLRLALDPAAVTRASFSRRCRPGAWRGVRMGLRLHRRRAWQDRFFFRGYLRAQAEEASGGGGVRSRRPRVSAPRSAVPLRSETP